MQVATKFVVALFENACGICCMLGLLGALQAMPAVSLVTSAIMQSGRQLLEFSVMVACIVPMIALILYTSNISDERLTLPTHLASYTLISTITGTRTQFSIFRTRASLLEFPAFLMA